VLVCFEKDAPWSLLDLASMKLELEQPFSREVDLVEKSTVEKSYNWIRREDILSSAQSLVKR
jgi:predicted nucleotidyltransferase